MCFDLDSHPPIRPLAGAVVEKHATTLKASDGNEFLAFHARPAEPTGKSIVILPDIRGLHHYYEELAVRFAEIGIDALAIDYFGRTAGIGARGDDFDYGPHVAQARWTSLSADITAAVQHTRGAGHDAKSVYTIGFCMGGRLAFLSTSLGLGLAGGIGFYGFPAGASGNGSPAPIDMLDKVECPILGIFGGADGAIPVATVQQYRDALEAAHLPSEIVVEPDAPHSFFDKKQADFQVQSEDAWARVRHFIENRAAG
jgi:carboxymethylenebutenolidase